MKVSLIEFTGINAPNPAQHAAKLLIYTKSTRLEQGEETRAIVNAMSEEEVIKNLGEIANTIRSSWEFVDYVFEVRDVTRAYTHQQVRTRVGVSFAQQAQRVVDMTDFKTLIPETVKKADKEFRWKHLMMLISSMYEELIRAGVPTQDARGVLPTNVFTNIIVKVNLRTLADLVGKRQNLRAQGEYADVVREMAARVLEVHPWANLFLYPERAATPFLDGLLKRLLDDRSPVDDQEINGALKELDKLKGTWG